MKRFTRLSIKRGRGLEQMVAYGRSDRGMRVVVGAAAYATKGLSKAEILVKRQEELDKILAKNSE